MLIMSLQNLRPLLVGMPEIQRLATLEMFAESVHDAIARNVQRKSVEEAIRLHAQGGKVRVVYWSRDCDCVEGYSSRLIDATLADYERWVNNFDAEGPWHVVSIVPPGTRLDLGEPRDRILEAFEDGHAWSV